VAMDAGYEVERQKVTFVNVYKGALDEIRRNLNALREGEKKPNWKREIERIAAFNKGDTEVIRVISDLYLKKDSQEIFISIKTVKPNLDQTEIAKKDMLLLKAHDPSYQTYFGLFYNPGGTERKDYNWMIPFKLFDMHNDGCVLIGKDFWNTVGGKNTYTDLIEIFAEVGAYTKQRIIEQG
ncbi:MAG: TdeIII family type II restriction endonuclease, partial [Bacteroidota bacterium]